MPDRTEIIARFYEVERRLGGLAKANPDEVAEQTAHDLGTEAAEVKSAVLDDLAQVGG